MIIFAIDPGTDRSGVVIFDGLAIDYTGKPLNSEVISLLREWEFDIVACERFKTRGQKAPGRETFEACEWSGRFRQVTDDLPNKPRWVWVTVQQARKHVCRNGNARDSHVIAHLTKRLGAKGTKASPGVTYGVAGDAWSALAVAVTVYDQLKHKEEKSIAP